MRRLRDDVRRRVQYGQLRDRLGVSFEAKQESRIAGVIGNNLVSIDGQPYAAAIDAPVGARVEVINVGRPGLATYAPKVGGGVVVTGGGGGSGGTVMVPGGGTTAANALLQDGSRPLLGNLIVANGITIDGVDIGAHVLLPDVHHARATGGDGIDVAGQDIAVDVTDILDTAYGLTENANNIRINLAAASGLEFATGALQIADAIAGVGLGIDAGKVLAVQVKEGIEIDSDYLRVDEDYAFVWEAEHRFNADPQIYADLDFMGAADRTITAAQNLTLAPTNNLVLDPTGVVEVPDAQGVQTTTFADLVTGITGFNMFDLGGNKRQITSFGAKFDELHTRVFVADETRIQRAETYLTYSFGIVEQDFVLPADEGTVDVWFEESPALGAAKIFLAGDWLMLRVIDWEVGMEWVTAWFEVVDGDGAGLNDYLQRADQDPGGAEPERPDRQQWRLKLKVGGTPGKTVKAGAVLLDAGVLGQGWIHSSAVKGVGPYIEIGEMTSAGTDTLAPVFTNYVRTGNLKGIGGIAVDTWGFAGAKNLGTAIGSGYEGFVLDAANGLRVYSSAISQYNGGTQTGSWLANGTFWLGLGSGDKRLYWDGANLSVVGSVTITGGSGYANLSDKPTLGTLAAKNAVALNTAEVTNKSLANLDSAANTKLGGIATGATVGATWGTNLGSIPAPLGAPSGAGLYLNADQMGYWNGSAWRTYMDSAGRFYFSGWSGARIAWDGTDLLGTDGTTVQWYARASTGKLYAGAGNVVLDSSGVTIYSTETVLPIGVGKKISFVGYGSKLCGNAYGYYYPGDGGSLPPVRSLALDTTYVAGIGSIISLLAYSGASSSPSASVRVDGVSGYVDIDGSYMSVPPEIRAQTSAGLSLTDDGGNLGVFIGDGGYVGVRTSSPLAELDVRGSIRIGTSTDTSSESTVMPQTHGGILLKATGTKSRTAALWMSDTTGQGLQINSDYNGAAFLCNVGFGGIQSPAMPLHVEGESRIQGAEATDGILGIYADQGDDNADRWRWVAAAASNQLRLETFASGAWANGVLTLGGLTFGDEVLSVYNEEAWTPTTGTGFTVAEGGYVRIGNMCHFSCRVVFNGSAGSSAVVINNLPFTAENSTYSRWGAYLTYADYGARLLVGTNTTNLQFFEAGGTGALTYTDVANKEFRITGMYRVA